ncbi:hypothetical protein ACG3RS_34715, partial [Pseudomonas aeruginosa]
MSQPLLRALFAPSSRSYVPAAVFGVRRLDAEG